MRFLSSRTLAASLTVALGMAQFPLSAFAFSDVGTSTSYEKAIKAMEEEGVIEGYSDGTFKPTAHVNRAEFLKIILEARGDVSFSGSNCFPDVDDDWYAKYVCTAQDEGIIQGYPDGTFRPEQPINFVEASKILALAYKQDVSMYSPDWYEPYARALESSKAIPLSIAGLDKLVTRGEMVEMMWRLSESITDQPAKGYVNVKYPEVAINTASDAVQVAKTCADLSAFSAEAARSGGTGFDDAVFLQEGVTRGVPTAPASNKNTTAADAPETGGGGDYSQTNVQVEGVDEADIVKADGNYLYIVSGQKVRIVRVNPANTLTLASVIDLEEVSFTPSDLYILGDRLVITGHRWVNYDQPHIMEKRIGLTIWPGPWYNSQKAEVRIYDISDRTKPELERKVAFDGNAVTTRRIEDKLYLVVNQQVPYWGRPIPLIEATEDDVLPRFEDSKNGEEDEPVTRCDGVSVIPHVPSPQYLTVGVIDLDSPNAEVEREVVLGSAENVYSSLDNLYIATTEHRYYWDPVAEKGPTEKTNLYRFAFEDDGVSMEAQGTVPGRILNQFSMDEHENTFRIATTTGYSWDAERPSTNNLYVLNMALDETGKIEEIAPGEQIYSVRFLGDRTYMVTFRNIDPLFVIDTSDPRNPKILGKLKIPGYSNYLHPYDENHILGFGKDAVIAKDPNFAWYQGMKMALFDVSDVENPKELHAVTIGDRGTDSPLLWNHKALLFEKDRDLLAFPITVAEIPASQKTGNDGSAYGSPVFQGAYVYELTLKDGFQKKGEITHYDEENNLKSGDVSLGYGRDIERIVRVGDSLLTISQGAVASHSEETVTEQDTLNFND
ncbi:MAG: beta-propeller domain-containing protein [Candidatus Peregrinibacteria bacterium]|nr:beta-propeller domain-containing protein [Candidatus Peregrinibacteria bacterium]